VARSTAVMAVDLATGQATPALVPLNRGHGALPIPGTGRVIATNGGSDTAVVFDGATGAVVATIPTGKKPDAVAYDPATKTVWVMNAGSGDITVVDAATLAVKGTVAVGGSLELGAADGKGLLYVNVEDKNDVAVIDTRAMTLKARFPLKGCDGPTGIVYAPAAKRVLSACANGVAVVSGADGALVASLKGGPRPDGAVYDPKRDLAFVPSGGDGTLSVIKMSGTPAVLATTPTAKGARTAALDEATGRIYLPAAQYAPAVGAARPAMIPGSFTVLVVAPQ
jgi:YVTN family beta-propeller protein